MAQYNLGVGIFANVLKRNLSRLLLTLALFFSRYSIFPVKVTHGEKRKENSSRCEPWVKVQERVKKQCLGKAIIRENVQRYTALEKSKLEAQDP
jgi:hypothetical protein